jgi:hypothetical protein
MKISFPWTSARRTFNRLVVLSILAAFGESAQAQNKACDLVTPRELQSVLGTAVSGMKGQPRPGSDAEICMGQASAYRVMLRLAKRSDTSGDKEAKGLAMAKQMGAQVDVKKFGDTTCSSFIPPANMQQAGYNTTCSVFKNGQVGAVEITTTSQKDMVPIETLRLVAEKIAGRL